MLAGILAQMRAMWRIWHEGTPPKESFKLYYIHQVSEAAMSLPLATSKNHSGLTPEPMYAIEI